MIKTSAVEELREMLAKRDDVPVDFSNESDNAERKNPFREYRTNWEHQTWQTERDNGSLYPSEDSYTPYLEKV